MDEVRWFRAYPDRSLLNLVTRYDHYRIDIEGEAAVLITYKKLTKPLRRLFAVAHPAAEAYPAVPDSVRRSVERLAWERSRPPTW